MAYGHNGRSMGSVVKHVEVEKKQGHVNVTTQHLLTVDSNVQAELHKKSPVIHSNVEVCLSIYIIESF